MAEEEKSPESEKAQEDAGEKGAAAPSKKGALLSKLLMPVGCTVGGLLLGIGVFMIFGPKSPEAPAKETKKESHAAKEEDHGEKEEEKEEKGHGEEAKEDDHKKEESGHHKEEKGHGEEAAHGGETSPGEGVPGEGGEVLFKFDPMVVNIFERNAIHYLKMGIELSLDNPAVIAEIQGKKAQLQDKIVFLASDTSLREILTTGGKALLKEDIQIAFNRLLKTGKVKDLYFTEFTVQ